MSAVSSILEVPEVRRRVASISVEAYHVFLELGAAAQRTELLRGSIVEKMTKSPLHASLVRRLYAIVSSKLRPGLMLQKEDPLTFADSEPEPDLAVVAGKPEDFTSRHPGSALLVIEVAVRTEEIDREKAAIYAEADVTELWLVLPERGAIEVLTQPVDGKYTRKEVWRRGETALSRTMTGVQVSVSELLG